MQAASFTPRLGLERARGMAVALELLGLPGAVLRGRGTLYAANALFAALGPDFVQQRRNRIRLADTKADRRLAEMLAQRFAQDETVAAGTIPVAGTGRHPPHILHVLPVATGANEAVSQPVSLLVAMPVARAPVPAAHVLEALFDLTPAEARLAGLIGRAKSPREAALALGVTEGSARVTLKRVLAKTGMRRQAELVSLLGGKALGAGEEE